MLTPQVAASFSTRHPPEFGAGRACGARFGASEPRDPDMSSLNRTPTKIKITSLQITWNLTGGFWKTIFLFKGTWEGDFFGRGNASTPKKGHARAGRGIRTRTGCWRLPMDQTTCKHDIYVYIYISVCTSPARSQCARPGLSKTWNKHHQQHPQFSEPDIFLEANTAPFPGKLTLHDQT